MEKEIYQVLKKHKLSVKKREEVLDDLLILLSVSERTWSVKEITEQLQSFQDANSASTWFHMYGRNSVIHKKEI